MKSPAFQFYPDKWQADTRRLSWKAKGLYHELMCVLWLQYQDTCSIPNDDQFIASELGCSEDDWGAAKAEIMNPNRPLLSITETNRLFSNGLHKELEKQEERRERLRVNGCKGGRPKNQKVSKTKPKHKAGSENLNERLPSPSSSPSPSTSFSTPIVPQGGLEFEEFWNAYPRKVGKDDAKKIFVKKQCCKILPEILAGIKKSKDSLEWTRDGGQYVPHPSTWLNQGRWSDEPYLNGDSQRLKPSESILKQKALERVEERMKTLKNHFPLPKGDPKIQEYAELRAERLNLMSELGLKA